jgi:Flp pilus assembly protein TadG
LRVQLRGLRGRRRDESGAIALLAAFLATGLCVIAAFTVDFGMAYISKQQLQEAADAGALSAAQVYKGNTGLPCATLAADSVLKARAQAAADSWAEQNRAGKRGGTVSVTCSASGLTVTYGTAGDTEVGLGQLAGVGERLTTSRIAAATIGKAKPGQLRPWGICSAVTSTSGQVIFVPMKDGSTSNHAPGTTCGPEGPPGGWWVMQCTGQGNGTGDTQNAVADGCSTDGYHAVPGQVTSDPAALLAFLKAACPSKTTNDTCLASDTGHNFQLTASQWQTLVGKTFTMPVMCAIPTCTHLAVSGTGNNASYAIQQMATVELCGFKIESSASTGWPTTGPCATSNPSGYRASDVITGTGFFLVIKDLLGGPGGDWSLPEYSAMRLTQ